MDSTLDKTCSQSSDDADSNNSYYFSAHSSTPSPSNSNEQIQPSESEIKHSDSINMSPQSKLPSKSVTVKAPESNYSNLPRGFVIFVNMPKSTMIVYFKAVLRKDDWSWDEHTSKVYMRFRHKDLGGMKYDYGPGSINRCVENYIIVNFTVHINRNIICSAAADTLDLSYKYVVQISQENSSECLLLAPHDYENANRVLQVSQEKLLSDEVVVVKQYDTFILPENTKISKAWTSITKLLSSSSYHKTVDDMRAKCLELHLGPSKDLLLRGNFYTPFEVNGAAMGILGVVESSYCQHYDNTSGVHDWINHKILNVFKLWIREVMEAVCKDENLKLSLKMASAVVLVCCNTVFSAHFKTQMHECITLTDELSDSMLKTLHISPDGEEYSFLETLMEKKQSRNLVVKSLAKLLQDIINRKINPTTITYLLKALPLLHFVREESTPHQPLKLSPREISWNDRVLSFDMIKPAVKNQKTKWFMGVYSEVEPLFELDPLLVFAVAYICPCIEVPELCQKMHLPYAIAFVARKLSQHLDRASKEIDVEFLFESLTVLSQRVADTLIDKQQLEHCFEGTYLLLDSINEQLMEVLCKQSKDVKCVTLSIAFMLYLTEKDSSGHWETAKPAIKKLLKCCVKKRGYGDAFGGRSRSQLEMQFWESILKQMAYSNSHLVLEWNKVIEEIVKERVEKVEIEVRIRLFSELEKRSHTPSLLTTIFMAEAAAAVDELVLKNKEDNSLEVSNLMSTMSDNVRKILGGLLKKKYPKVNKNTSIPLEDLLEWELWSGFINLYATRNKVLTEANIEKWCVICACALSTLEDVCMRVENGNIPITELRKIENRKGQMNKLCEAAVFEHGASVLPVDKFNEKFKQRITEYNHFEHYRKVLKRLLECLSAVNVQGVEELREAVKSEDDYEDRPINSLCIVDNGRYHVTCFPTAAPLEPCLNCFWRMACSEEKCDYFFHCWNERLVFVNKIKVILTPEKVISEIWQPVFTQCQTLHKQLVDCSLLLSEVDRVFKGQKSDDITKSLTQLHLGVAEDDEENIQWIDEVVKRMEQYWKLCQYAEAAKAFLKLIAVLKLDSLKHSAEYELLEHVSDCLMEGQTLRNIVEYDMSATVILEEYAADKKKRDCLTAFAECQEIVTWIRRETNGVEDLQSFVTIALATAVGGEDDLTKDKLSNLRTVGSGFRALIYELPHTTKPTSLLTQVYVGEQACASVTEPDIKTQIVSQIDTKTLLLIEAIGEHNNDGSHTTTEEAVNEYDIVEHGLGLELPLNESSDDSGVAIIEATEAIASVKILAAN